MAATVGSGLDFTIIRLTTKPEESVGLYGCSSVALRCSLRVSTREFCGGCAELRKTVGSSARGKANRWETNRENFLKSVHGPSVSVTLHDAGEDASSGSQIEGGAASALVEEAVSFDSKLEPFEEEQINYTTLVWRAVKLPLYSVAFIPLTVGAAAAFLQTGSFHGGRYFSFLFFSVLVIAWLNLSNDAFDAATGADKDKKESVVNMTGSRNGVLLAAIACLVVAGWGILSGAKAVNDPRVGAMLAAAVGCGYVYQSPPFRLSYKGLGEPLCFVAFGPLATCAFYLYLANTSTNVGLPAVSVIVKASSVLVGITTTLILFCSHFHQIEGDLAVGKMSPLVRLGTARGARVVQLSVLALYGLTAAFVGLGALPLTCMVGALATAPIGKMLVEFVRDNHTNKTKIFMAKYFCVRLHVAFGLALATALVLGRWQPF